MTDDTSSTPPETLTRSERALHAALSPAMDRVLVELCTPHWVPEDRFQASQSTEVLAAVEFLIGEGLVRRKHAGFLQVDDHIRDYVLDQAIQSARDQWLQASIDMARMFEGSENPLERIEHHYLMLAAEPEETSRAMFLAALELSSAPIFAFEELRRLLLSWREHEGRVGLPALAGRYLKFAGLLSPYERLPPAEELAVLAQIKPGDDPRLTAEWLLRRSMAMTAATPDAEEIEPQLVQALELFASIGVQQGAAATRYALARLYVKRNQFDQAIASAEVARTIYLELGLSDLVASCLKTIGETQFLLGDLAEALKELKLALVYYQAGYLGLGAANALVVLAQVLAFQGDVDQAQSHLQTAEGLYVRLDHKLGMANVAKAQAYTSLVGGDRLRAAERINAAMALYEKWGTQGGQISALVLLARVARFSGEIYDAVHHADTAFALVPDSDLFARAEVSRERGIIYRVQDEPLRAGFLLQEAADMFKHVGAKLEAALTLRAAHDLDIPIFAELNFGAEDVIQSANAYGALRALVQPPRSQVLTLLV